MTEKMKEYDEIRKQYPEMISKDQFYRIAHISKLTALYLLKSGLVPCQDSGKKTRRYKIRMDDVIWYLIDREIHPAFYRAPDNWYTDHYSPVSVRATYWKKFLKLTYKEKAAFRKYLKEELEAYDDLMGVREVAEIIGYSETTICEWCKDKKIKSFLVYNKFLIPKINFIDFLVFESRFVITRKSWKYILLIKSFFDQREKR